jgi:secondary thiamine-phosphate synthase enzyme
MQVFHKTFHYNPKKKFHFIDVTDDVASCVSESGIKQGIVQIYCPHTTVAVKINESEDGFKEDFAKLMSELVPKDRYYKHNDLDIRKEETLCTNKSLCVNGDSHILQMLVGTTSESIPVEDGKVMLGSWQRIFLIELDKKRDRRLEIRVFGV